eukprot:UN15633
MSATSQGGKSRTPKIFETC